MKRRLFWKLCSTVAAGTVLLFWAIDYLSEHAEQRMSHIAKEHQQTLKDYGTKAEALYRSGDMQQLGHWLEGIQARENTWASVVTSEITPLANSHLSQQFVERFKLGRDVEWKIHLYFAENPIMDVTFADGNTHFLIQLPQRMRPGAYWGTINILLQIALPFLLLSALCILIYRHVMGPIRVLERAAQKMSEGNYDVRIQGLLGDRKDELSNLADTFDTMAEHTGTLIRTQRHLTADLSHELRTPLTRIDMAVSWAEETTQPCEALNRIRQECNQMRDMVEDTLTLAWLENENPVLEQEDFDLTDLLDSIAEDARFEFPNHIINIQLPEQAPVHNSNQRALAQAFENIIRNALRHTPENGQVSICLNSTEDDHEIQISDQGPGIANCHLQHIFKPFFRVQTTASQNPKGFGLGLALAYRQIQALQGSLRARNRSQGGLKMIIRLPR